MCVTSTSKKVVDDSYSEHSGFSSWPAHINLPRRYVLDAMITSALDSHIHGAISGSFGGNWWQPQSPDVDDTRAFLLSAASRKEAGGEPSTKLNYVSFPSVM